MRRHQVLCRLPARRNRQTREITAEAERYAGSCIRVSEKASTLGSSVNRGNGKPVGSEKELFLEPSLILGWGIPRLIPRVLRQLG